MYINHIEVYPESSRINVVLGNSRISIAMPKELELNIISMASAEAARFMSNLNVSSVDVLDESLRFMKQPIQATIFDPGD